MRTWGILVLSMGSVAGCAPCVVEDVDTRLSIQFEYEDGTPAVASVLWSTSGGSVDPDCGDGGCIASVGTFRAPRDLGTTFAFEYVVDYDATSHSFSVILIIPEDTPDECGALLVDDSLLSFTVTVPGP